MMLGRIPSYDRSAPFQTVSKLDFSHLRAKGLEVRSSPQCVSSAVKVPTLLLPTITTRFMALHPTYLREHLFQYSRPLISRETFWVSLPQTDMQKVPKAFVEGLTEAVSSRPNG